MSEGAEGLTARCVCSQAQTLDADDPTAGYMLQAGARLCKTLGEEFLPYLGAVMPPLLHSAQLKPDVDIADEGSGDDADDEDGEVGTRAPCLRPACDVLLLPHITSLACSIACGCKMGRAMARGYGLVSRGSC